MKSTTKKGLTLIEILIAMALLAIITVFGTSIMGVFVKGGEATAKATGVQDSLRVTSSTVKNVIMNASSIFILNDSAFDPSNHTPGWSYIGLETNADGKDEVVHYIYNPESAADTSLDTHNRVVLCHPTSGAALDLNFTTDSENPSKVNFTTKAINDDSSEISRIESSTESLNASNIINWSTSTSKAIAYRVEGFEVDAGTEIVYQPALIGFTLDKSGSMNWDMAGNSTSDPTKRRTYFLRNSLYNFVNKFADTPGVYITSNAFGWSVDAADVRSPKELVSPDLDDLRYMFNPSTYANNGYPSGTDFIRPDGNTNGGDGLRILYHQMRGDLPAAANYVDPPGVADMKKMYIVVSDGENNTLTFENSFNQDHDIDLVYRGPKFTITTTEDYTWHTTATKAGVNYHVESNLSKPFGNSYMISIAKFIVANEPADTEYFAIAVGKPLTFFHSLGEAFGHGAPTSDAYKKHMFTAETADQLDAAFVSIMDTVSMNIELLRGPNR